MRKNNYPKYVIKDILCKVLEEHSHKNANGFLIYVNQMKERFLFMTS